MTMQDKLHQARVHIQRKQYREARAILCTIQHNPTAKEWLCKIEEILSQRSTEEITKVYPVARV